MLSTEFPKVGEGQVETQADEERKVPVLQLVHVDAEPEHVLQEAEHGLQTLSDVSPNSLVDIQTAVQVRWTVLPKSGAKQVATQLTVFCIKFGLLHTLQVLSEVSPY